MIPFDRIPCPVKICGLALEKDIDMCMEEGVDAVGLLLASSGSDDADLLSLATAERLARYAEGRVASVLLLKSEDPELLESQIRSVRPTAVQLQAVGLDIEQLLRLRSTFPDLQIIRTLRSNLSRSVLLERALRIAGLTNAILLDAPKGGSGVRLDWSACQEIALVLHQHGIPVVLAGGLTPDNVVEAIRTVNPSMVDTMSGVSSARGVKDRDLVSRFVRAVRSTAEAK